MTTRPSAPFTSAPTLARIMAPDLVVRELTVSGTVAEKVAPTAPATARGFGAGGLGFGATGVVVGVTGAGAGAPAAAGVAAVSAIGLVESC